MSKSQNSVLFIGDCSFWSEQAYEFLTNTFNKVTAVFWESGMSENSSVETWTGDWIISFKSDLILDEKILAQARKGAVNFHPSSTKYRGIGGYYYAIDNEDKSFGVTCHHMDKNIDHGQIIKTLQFRIAPNENANLLRQRTAANCLILLHDICITIALHESLPNSHETWSSKLYTKKTLRAYMAAKTNQIDFNLQ